MKKRLKAGVFGLLLFAGMALALSGCPDSPEPPPVETTSGITHITVEPDEVDVTRGNNQQFTVEVHGTGNPSQDVNWTVEGGIAGTSINYGYLSVDANETATTLIVRATSTADTSKSGIATVTVPASVVDHVTISLMGPDPFPATIEAKKGGRISFTATVEGTEPTNPPPQTVTWNVTGGGAGTSIDANGILTVALGETATELTVTATSTYDTDKFDTADVAISGTATVHGVNVYPQDSSVAKGRTRTFTANVYGPDNPMQDVTWSVSGEAAVGTTISQEGVLTVDANETATELTVTATSVVDPLQSGTATVTVLDTPEGEVGINIMIAFDTIHWLSLSYNPLINLGSPFTAEVLYYLETNYKWYIDGVLKASTSSQVSFPITERGIHYGLVIVTIDGVAFSRDFTFRVQ